MDDRNRLLIRALEKGLKKEPSADFTFRVMERIQQQRRVQERHENRILLAGAVCCGVGMIFFAVVLIQTYADVEFGSAFSRAWASVGDAFHAVRPAASNPVTDDGDGTLLWLWSYMALLFLAFGAVGELLRRKRL